jgi:hypothetical protein
VGRDSIREVVVPLLNSNGGDPMSHWLHARCPTCGQAWPVGTPHKQLRRAVHWLVRLLTWAVIVSCLLGICRGTITPLH